MRRRVFLVCIVALIVSVLLIVLRPPKQQKPASNEGSAVETNQPQQLSETKPPEQHGQGVLSTAGSALAVSSESGLPPNASPLAQAIAKTNLLAARRLARWQGLINFYGKVVDENGNPVAGAAASFHWVEFPDKIGNRNATATSDANGLFELRDKRGLSLAVSVRKDGYYSSKSDNDTFNFGELNGDPFPADPQNPVIFHLRRKGQGVSLVTSDNGIRPNLDVRIPKDNTPVRVDLMKKAVAAEGPLQISQNKPPWKEATEWSFQLSIPDGGLVESQDEFQFQAPEGNYQQSVDYHFSKTETNWPTHVVKQFYIAFGQPRKYGWLRIESDIAQETVFLTYAINPSGDRNLEPAK